MGVLRDTEHGTQSAPMARPIPRRGASWSTAPGFTLGGVFMPIPGRPAVDLPGRPGRVHVTPWGDERAGVGARDTQPHHSHCFAICNAVQ